MVNRRLQSALLAGCGPATAHPIGLRDFVVQNISLRDFVAMAGRGGRDRHGEERRGGPPWARQGGPGGFPFGGPGGPPFGRPPFGPWRANKARRGDVRTAILAVLADGPLNGYQVIQQIGERTGGAWKPSPGSVYPTLQQLEDEALVRADESDGRRLFHLTDAGRTYVEEHADELAATWETVSDDPEGPASDMKGSIGQVMAAVWQVMHNGSDAQRAQAREVLERTRRDLYQILADGTSAGSESDDTST